MEVKVLIGGMSRTALKEWDAVVEALASGSQTILVRKGGLRDDVPRFDLKSREFFLYPTRYHESSNLLKPEVISRIDSETPEDEDVVELAVFAEVCEVLEASTEEELEALSPFHIWNKRFTEKRLAWRPRQAVTVMIVRVYLLEQPQALMIMEDYKGCKSWVEFVEDYPVGNVSPVMNSRRFRSTVAKITDALDTARRPD